MTDPIKYKLKAYLQYEENDYAGAKANLDSYFEKIDKSRIIPSDSGLESLIYAGLATKEADAAAKATLMQKSAEKMAVVKAANDDTLNWDGEYAKVISGAGELKAKADAGPTNENIEALKKQAAANKEDTTILFNLAQAYEAVSNWEGSALTWQKINELLPTWEPAFYSKGYALQKGGYNQPAALAYLKYIDVVLAKPAAEQQPLQDNLYGAYYNVALLLKDADKAKAIENIGKALAIKPTDQSALSLQKILNK